MATQRYLSILFRTLLSFSLLMRTGTGQYRETANRHAASSILSPGVDLSLKSIGRLNSDLGHSESAARMSELDGFPDELTNDDTHGRALRADNLVTRGIVHNLDAKVRQTSSNSLCEYTVVIQTGNQDGAGTDSDITLLLSRENGDQVYLKDIANGHKTFEKGHKDTFVFPGQPCFTDLCKLVLYTDDYGPFSEWFVVSVKVKVVNVLDPKTGFGRILQEKEWTIYEWLPREDANEELYTIRDDCDSAK